MKITNKILTMLFSKLQQSKLNFYSKYNLAKSQQDIFSLFTLMKSTDDYIRYLEQLTFTSTIDKDGTNQSPQYSPISSPHKKQVKGTKQSGQRIEDLTDEEKDNKFREMEHKLNKLQKLEKRFHQKIAQLQLERRRKRQIKELRKMNKEKMKSQVTNVKEEESSSPRYTKQQLTITPAQIQTSPHQYEDQDNFDGYYDQTPQVRIMDSIQIDRYSNCKNIKTMLEQQKTNQKYLQKASASIKSYNVSLQQKQQNKQEKFNRINIKGKTPTMNEINFKQTESFAQQIQGSDGLKSSLQKGSELNQFLFSHTDSIMQMKDKQQNPYQQIVRRINDLQIQSQIAIHQNKHLEADGQIEEKHAYEGELQDNDKYLNQDNGQPITHPQPNIQEYESNVTAFVLTQKQSPMKHIPADQSQTDVAGPSQTVNQQATGPHFHYEVFLQTQSQLYRSNFKQKSQREERQLIQKKLMRESIAQNKASAIPKFSISSTINQQITTFSINTESQTKPIQQPPFPPITSEKPKKLNFKQALQKAKGAKVVNIENKRFVADQQSNSRKESKNALFLNFFKQN